MSSAHDDEEQNFASVIMGEILFGNQGAPPGFGTNLGISNQSISAFTLPSTGHSLAFKNAPYAPSSMDGPIRPKASIEDELLFHPFDEVSVVNPKDFAKEHGIELDLTDGHGCITQASYGTEGDVAQNNASSTSQTTSSTPTKPSEAESTRPIVMKSAYNGVMQLKTEPESDSSRSPGFLGADANPSLNGATIKPKLVKPISKAEFKDQCDRLGLRESSGIVASISGGPDSMAMALLLAEYCVTANLPMLCVTVDHAMRPEAPAEALVTQTWLHALGIPHTIVRVEWPNGAIPTQGIQSKAREARYEAVTKIAMELQKRLAQILTSEEIPPPVTTIPTKIEASEVEEAPKRRRKVSKEAGKEASDPSLATPSASASSPAPPSGPVVPKVHILMAHNADDNVETFWLRMAGCSGLYGLAGIAEKRIVSDGVFLTRPVLAFSKLRLYATLIAASQPWASDPSNAKLLYKRNQVRHTLDSLYSTSTASTSISPPSTIDHPHAKSSILASVSALEKSSKILTSDRPSQDPLSAAVSVATAPFTSTPATLGIDDYSVSLEDMARLQHNFAKSRFLLDSITHRFCSDYISVSKKYGYIIIPTQPLLHLPEIFAFRVLDTVLAHISGDSSPMRLKSIKTCLNKVRAAAEVMDIVPLSPSELEATATDSKDGTRPQTTPNVVKIAKPASTALPTAGTRAAAESSNLSANFCVHRCILLQTPRRLTIVMQNMPNAPAALVGDKTPLPPYRADTALPFGRDKTIHWLNSWRLTYESNTEGETLFGGHSGSLPSPLPKRLYVRQLQSFDLPILRKLGPSYTSWSTRLSRHVLLSLPVIVDENSHIIEFPFLLPGGRTIASLPDGDGLAPLSLRTSIERFAQFQVISDPAYHLTERPKSTFVGYSRIQKQKIPDPLSL